MYAIPPGPAFHRVPPGITSSIQAGPVFVPPVMPLPSIRGVEHVGHRQQHPANALQQVPQLDPGPSQPYGRHSFDDTPIPYHPLQAKAHSSTSDRRSVYQQHHNVPVVPVSEVSHVATDGSYSSRSSGKASQRHSYPAHNVRPRSHEHHLQEAAYHRPHPSYPAQHVLITRSDKRAAHSHSDHRAAHGHAHSTTHSAHTSNHHHPHHRDDEPPPNDKLSKSYKPTPPPSDASERGRSSVEVEEPRPRELSVPRHRTLRPGPSAMKSHHHWGMRRRRGPVHFLLRPGVEDAAENQKTSSRSHRFGWPRSRWPGSRNKNRV